jgi:hypothetical protein
MQAPALGRPLSFKLFWVYLLRCLFVAGVMLSVAPPTEGMTFMADFSQLRTKGSAI